MLVAFGSLDDDDDDATVGSDALGSAVVLVELGLVVDDDGDGDGDGDGNGEGDEDDTSTAEGEGTTAVSSATGGVVGVAAESGMSGSSRPSCFAHSSALRFSGQQ